jgi:hypothetical protein
MQDSITKEEKDTLTLKAISAEVKGDSSMRSREMAVFKLMWK